MNEKGMPLLQMTPVADSGRDPRTVLKVEVAPPLKCAVAVVLDLSDSCATMQVEIARLPRLFEALPRSWPVWIYRLSEIQPLHSSATVAHVCDRSVDLMQWAGDRRTVERAQGTGSYLRPPLEAIIARAEQAGISRVKVLILTDGELLDSASLAVPQGIEVVGLTARQDGNSQACWHRVRPDSRLCLLSDSTLDECFRQADCTFYGSCQIALDDLQAFKPILHRNSQSGTISTIDQPSVSWNFVDGPLLLQISAAPNALANSELVVKSLRTNTSTHLKLEGVSPIAISPQELAAFAKMPARELRSEFEASADDKNFPVIWSAFCEAAKIAIDRASWVDEAGHLRVFTDAIFRGRLWNGERISVSDSWL